MAERGSFFNSVSGDRKYSAEDWAAYFASFVSNGVYANPSNGLQVVIATGMGITIKAGAGFINGYFYRNTTDLGKTLSVADGVYNRIDRIVLRWSLLNRKLSVEVLEGVPATTPTATALTRDAEIYEIALADVYIGRGVTAILQSNITDRRFDSSLCGIVTGIIDQFDFSSLCTQFDAFFAEYKVRIANEYDYFQSLGQDRYDSFDQAMDTFEASAQSNFNDWFANLQYVLDGDVAGHLQNEIDAMEAVVNTAVAELEQSMQETIEEVRLTGFSTYTHAKEGTVHSLTLAGGGSNVKFVATAAYAKNDTFKVNGGPVTVRLSNGKAPGNNFFVTGAVVIGFLSGTDFFLVGGGGGGSGEQYLATLTVANWYQQTPDTSEEFWYAYDIAPSDFDSNEQDVVVSAANADTYDWLAKNAFYELAIKNTGFSIQAKEEPTKALQIFYELKTRGES